ncbi:hypothetical protein JQ615_38380 [Bradyrhizobium jicamae]|uniref:Uncharacterized protein n=1 Tax=Bradyrhizobium jicamae TaxID=280332 RepID=A0ABS5FWS8_9BRAD|nr:hypothetical protein [Bradyrhizobium jicamae]MBR0801237.1 hypothetical protein [Bradyrhizobium jicamae]
MVPRECVKFACGMPGAASGIGTSVEEKWLDENALIFLVPRRNSRLLGSNSKSSHKQLKIAISKQAARASTARSQGNQ